MSLRRCPGCQRDVPVSEFYLSRGKPMRKCKPCERSRSTTRLQHKRKQGQCYRCPLPALPDRTHCQEHLESENARLRNEGRKLKRLAIEFLGGKCIDCGLVSVFDSVYDFHHLDPTQKDFGIAAIRAKRLTQRIIAELLKCVLLCSNCHRIRHEKENYAGSP